MIVFYSENLITDSGALEGEDAKHCYKVLRKKEGDSITVLNGQGRECHCIITSISKNTVQFRVERSNIADALPHLPIIGISLLRTTSRLEWFLEKATEIGIGEIIPMHCDRTVKGKFRHERANNILISSTKQSLRLWKPKLHEDQKIKDIITNTDCSQKYICHYSEQNPHLYDTVNKDEKCYILIGPEGDFSDAELELAISHGWTEVNIGNSRLRAETAGITAVQIIALKNRQS